MSMKVSVQNGPKKAKKRTSKDAANEGGAISEQVRLGDETAYPFLFMGEGSLNEPIKCIDIADIAEGKFRVKNGRKSEKGDPGCGGGAKGGPKQRSKDQKDKNMKAGNPGSKRKGSEFCPVCGSVVCNGEGKCPMCETDLTIFGMKNTKRHWFDVGVPEYNESMDRLLDEISEKDGRKEEHVLNKLIYAVDKLGALPSVEPEENEKTAAKAEKKGAAEHIDDNMTIDCPICSTSFVKAERVCPLCLTVVDEVEGIRPPESAFAEDLDHIGLDESLADEVLAVGSEEDFEPNGKDLGTEQEFNYDGIRLTPDLYDYIERFPSNRNLLPTDTGYQDIQGNEGRYPELTYSRTPDTPILSPLLVSAQSDKTEQASVTIMDKKSYMGMYGSVMFYKKNEGNGKRKRERKSTLKGTKVSTN